MQSSSPFYIDTVPTPLEADVGVAIELGGVAAVTQHWLADKLEKSGRRFDAWHKVFEGETHDPGWLHLTPKAGVDTGAPRLLAVAVEMIERQRDQLRLPVRAAILQVDLAASGPIENVLFDGLVDPSGLDSSWLAGTAHWDSNEQCSGLSHAQLQEAHAVGAFTPLLHVQQIVEAACGCHTFVVGHYVIDDLAALRCHGAFLRRRIVDTAALHRPRRPGGGTGSLKELIMAAAQGIDECGDGPDGYLSSELREIEQPGTVHEPLWDAQAAKLLILRKLHHLSSDMGQAWAPARGVHRGKGDASVRLRRFDGSQKVPRAQTELRVPSGIKRIKEAEAEAETEAHDHNNDGIREARFRPNTTRSSGYQRDSDELLTAASAMADMSGRGLMAQAMDHPTQEAIQGGMIEGTMPSAPPPVASCQRGDVVPVVPMQPVGPISHVVPIQHVGPVPHGPGPIPHVVPIQPIPHVVPIQHVGPIPHVVVEQIRMDVELRARLTAEDWAAIDRAFDRYQQACAMTFATRNPDWYPDEVRQIRESWMVETQVVVGREKLIAIIKDGAIVAGVITAHKAENIPPAPPPLASSRGTEAITMPVATPEFRDDLQHGLTLGFPNSASRPAEQSQEGEDEKDDTVAQVCWGALLKNDLTGSDCLRMRSGKGAFKNKFCELCSEGIDVPVDRVRILGPGLYEYFPNSRATGLWKVAHDNVGGGRFRLANNTIQCDGPWVILYRDAPPKTLQWAPMPKEWVSNNVVRFVVAKGTLVPACEMSCPSGTKKRLSPGEQPKRQRRKDSYYISTDGNSHNATHRAAALKSASAAAAATGWPATSAPYLIGAHDGPTSYQVGRTLITEVGSAAMLSSAPYHVGGVPTVSAVASIRPATPTAEFFTADAPTAAWPITASEQSESSQPFDASAEL
uniref:Uncharacterized protein n=1 Tax=Haptolina brevifila TaxID=156173 RepID=A0A7S2MJW5_9EUKA|mmetsp:Transcript_53487/g.106429  ORF Transcript_53487/g.106429 Transcript_53487/m.106429 type:complete len:911 (+) Transcript_53487:84-2816(+)|eukprot:CAMPEP_0174739476 /NCGR_PEP_ID=MMETSP1094-20130205/71669_1 /TAXON_ID=156173 /ORGANISM="Chrysochromulina brevifilum, Strain UTEX LB 985" /LENGTH=910 /DNA_ID=CAMNT_0015943043 /DNA_START=77 /DNA_END=2809 /DNA_ORIENTATION=+